MSISGLEEEEEVEEEVEVVEAVSIVASTRTGSPSTVSLESFECLYAHTIPNPMILLRGK